MQTNVDFKMSVKRLKAQSWTPCLNKNGQAMVGHRVNTKIDLNAQYDPLKAIGINFNINKKQFN